MELKEGMYVRFKNNKNIQYIGKIVNINEYREPSLKYATQVSWYEDYIFIGDSDIIGEPSFDIIDLIKVGDYVNGNKVTKLGFDKLLLHCKTIECHQEDLSWGYEGVTFMYTNNDIKDVITKEQFEAMKYVVERDD